MEAIGLSGALMHDYPALPAPLQRRNDANYPSFRLTADCSTVDVVSSEIATKSSKSHCLVLSSQSILDAGASLLFHKFSTVE